MILWPCYLDLRHADTIHAVIEDLIVQLGGLDLCIICAGIWPESSRGECDSPEIPLDWVQETINVNVLGCSTTIHSVLTHFIAQRQGHLVGITSVDAVRGAAIYPTYCASKAFMSVFLEGIRNRLIQLNIPTR